MRDFLLKQIKLLMMNEKILVTELRTEVWRRDEQVPDLPTKLSPQALHAEDASQHQKQERAGPHRHLTGLVHHAQLYPETFEESRAGQSAAGPEIDRFRQREAELLRGVRRHIIDRANIDAPFVRDRTNLESTNPKQQKASTHC